MKSFLTVSIKVAALFLLMGTASLTPAATRQESFETLRSGLAGIRLGLRAEPPNTQPDFLLDHAASTTSPDEVTLTAITQALLAPSANVDDPRRTLLAHAINELLITSAQIGSEAGATDVRSIRGKLLSAAAQLQEAYKQEVAANYDAVAGPVTSQVNEPDLSLPGGVQIKRIAGGGRINTATGAFSGRLAGTVLLPGLDASLTVPNGSFDSEGNIDLTAYGQAFLPPTGSDRFRITIPARRPLQVHVSSDGDWRLSGGAEVLLPNGAAFTGTVDIDDPNYAFGLNWGGELMLDLSKKVIVAKPVFNFEGTTPLVKEAIDGMGHYFGSLGQGLETFITASPTFPVPSDLAIGAVPDFKAPETVLPLDVLDAWIVALGNDTLRPVVSGGFATTTKAVKEALSSIKSDAAAASAATSSRMAQLQKLRRIMEQMKAAREAVSKAAAQASLGAEGAPILTAIQQNIQTAFASTQVLLNAILAQGGAAEVKDGLAAIELMLQIAAVNELAGGTGSAAARTSALNALPGFATRLLQPFGLNSDGTIANQTTFNGLSSDDLDTLVRLSMGLQAQTLQLSGAAGTTLITNLLRHAITRAKSDYDAAVAAGNKESRTIKALRLDSYLEKLVANGTALTTAEKSMLVLVPQTFAALAGSPTTNDLEVVVTKLMEAGRRFLISSGRLNQARAAEMQGLPPPSRTELEKDRFPSLWEMLFGGIARRQAAGVPASATDQTELRRVTKVMLQADLSSLDAEINGLIDTQKDGQTSMELLQVLLNGVAFVDEFLPTETTLINDYRTKWQAIHLKWVALAEAQKVHWLMSAYAREIASAMSRYGDGVSSSLQTAMRTSGSQGLAGLNRVVTAMTTLVSGLSNSPQAFNLGGNVNLKRLSGTLAFNRSTGAWSIGLGGRIEIPNSDFFLDVANGNLSSNGNYSLTASTGGTIGGGSNSQLKINVPTLSIAGTSSALTSASGAASITISNPQRPAEAPQTLAGTVTYSSSPAKLGVAITSVPIIKLGDDVVLLSGTASSEFSTAQPNGALTLGGRIGLLRRNGSNPLPANPTANDFQLLVDISPTTFAYSATDLTATLTGGTITLPPDVFTRRDAQNNPIPATITLSSNLRINLNYATGALTFSNGANQPVSLTANNLFAAIPGATGVTASLNSATLSFPVSGVPILSNLSATLSFPLAGRETEPVPTGNQGLVLNLAATGWKLDGFPQAVSIALGSDLRIIDLPNFVASLKSGTGLGFTSSVTNGVRTTIATLTGNARVEVSNQTIGKVETNGDLAAVAAETGATLSWNFRDFPSLTMNDLTIAGRIKIGGPGGFELSGVNANGIPESGTEARVTISGLSQAFKPTAAQPFGISVSGAIGLPNLAAFGLQNARVVWDGVQNPEPSFTVQSIGFRADAKTDLFGLSALPVKMTAGSITFINPALPVNQLFAATNMRFTVSGSVDIALPGTEDSPEGTPIPRLFGAVDQLQISFPGGFNAAPEFSLNTLGLALENLTVGDMAGISGGLIAGNLQDPPNLFFAGLAGATFNGVGLKLIVATRLDGLLGACLKADLGPVGIPLDGGTLGGILLTGAEGGISFANDFADPCDFRAYLNLDANGEPNGSVDFNRPKTASKDGGIVKIPSLVAGEFLPTKPVGKLAVTSWAELHELNQMHHQEKELRQWIALNAPEYMPQSLSTATRSTGGSGGTTGPPCPSGECPSATINLLCQRHPSVGEENAAKNYNGKYKERIIFKFSSLTQKEVARILQATNVNLNGTTSQVAAAFAAGVKNFVGGLIPGPGGSMPTSQADSLRSLITAALGTIETQLVLAVEQVLTAPGDSRPIKEKLYEAAYAGVKCQDLTIQLKGTFSYAPVSMALSATGGAVASTTGTAGVMGSVNLMGIPVGTGEFYFSATDSNGLPNPSFCGRVNAALGPLELGQMAVDLKCPNCVTGTLEALNTFITGVISTGDAAIRPLMVILIDEAQKGRPAGHRINDVRTSNRSLAAYFGAPPAPTAANPYPPSPQLSMDEQIAVLTGLLNLDKLAKFLEANPAAANEARAAVLALGPLTIDLILDLYNAASPDLAFCGQVEPKIFGFSLSGGNTLFEGKLFANKTRIAGDFAFSPSYILGNLPFQIMSGGAISNIVPALDQASVGFSVGLPTLSRDRFQLLSRDPLGFAAAGLDDMLGKTTLAFGYQLQPFGIKLANGQGRVVLPTIALHPDNPNRTGGAWVLPTNITRGAILKQAAACDVLQVATWEGKGTQLAELYPVGSPERTALVGKELVRDFFPYGGIMGAAAVSLPAPLVEAPPMSQINTAFAPTVTLTERLAALDFLFNQYLLGSSEIGSLEAYVPFPKPPAAFWQLPTALRKPQAFIDSLASLTPDQVAANLNIYPADQFFMQGRVNAQLFGLPLAQGELIADPQQGLFRISAGITPGSWLAEILNAQVLCEIKAPTYMAGGPAAGVAEGQENPNSPNARLQAAFAALTSAPAAQKAAALDAAVQAIGDSLPKAQITAEAGIKIPDSLKPYVRAGVSAGFYAFSPRFEPNYASAGYTGQIRYPDPDPSDPGPYTLARRNGGVVMAGALTLGAFLNDADPNNDIDIDIPEASLGIVGPSTGLIPGLAGRLIVDEVDIPGLPKLTNGLLVVNTAADIGQTIFGVRAELEPIRFRLPGTTEDLLSLVPLRQGENLGGELFIKKAANNGATIDLAVNACQFACPLLAGDIALYIYGSESPDGPDADSLPEFTDFTFTNRPGVEWSASICIASRQNFNAAPSIELKGWDPTRPMNDQPVAARLRPTGRICGTIRGEGMNFFALELELPSGLALDLFPGSGTEVAGNNVGSRQGVDANTPMRLYLDSRGRFYADLGMRQNIGLPGIITASGRIELGNNPDGTVPGLEVTALPSGTTLPMGTVTIGQSLTKQFRVRNKGAQQLHVSTSINDGRNYSLSTSGFTLSASNGSTANGGPDEAIVDVIFAPEVAGALNSSVNVSTNDGTSAISVTGTGRGVPRYVQMPPTVQFPGTVINGTAKATYTIANEGAGAFNVTSLSVTGGPIFSAVVNGQTSFVPFTLNPGQSQLIVCSFTPTSLSTFSGSVTLNVVDPTGFTTIGTKTTPLAGTGIEPRWVTVLDQAAGNGNSSTLNDILMVDRKNGFVVGDNGTVLETKNGGRGWIPRNLTKNTVKALGQRVSSQWPTNTVVATYHFEEPDAATRFRDDGPSGLHGTAGTGANQPSSGMGNGIFSSGGVLFNGLGSATPDVVNLGNFDLQNDWSISLWVNPTATDDGQAFLAQHNSLGTDQFLFGFYNGGYRVSFGSNFFSAGTKQTGWQHLVLNGVFNSTLNQTTVTLMRGTETSSLTTVWTSVFTGTPPNFASGRPWMLGSEWDIGTLTDGLDGQIDELYFFNGSLTTTAANALREAGTEGRIVMAGLNGLVLESANRGRSWHYPLDANVTGWRQRFREFRDYDWYGVSIGTDGRIGLAGNKLPRVAGMLSGRQPCLMFEKLFAGTTAIGDEEYDEALLDSNEAILTLGTPAFLDVEEVFARTAILSDGTLWRDSGTQFSRMSPTAFGVLNDLEALGTSSSLIAVGNEGTIVVDTNTTDPTVVGSTALTTEDLFKVKEVTLSSGTEQHIVGDNGAYIVRKGGGTTLQSLAEGLKGNNRGLSVLPPAGTGDYEAWAVGENYSIQYRPEKTPTGSFINFYPGELNFGLVTPQQVKTLPLKIWNRGRTDLVITGASIVGGSGFSVVQANVPRLAPGDSFTLQVRYRPPAAIATDYADLVLPTNDSNQTFRIPLTGSGDATDWVPVILSDTTGAAVQGTVVDLAFIQEGAVSSPSRTGLAVVQTASASKLFRTTNGGVGWSDVTSSLPALSSGQFYVLNGVDLLANGANDVALLAGEVRNATGFVSGRVFRSTTGGASWSNVTPSISAASGQSFVNPALFKYDVLAGAVTSKGGTSGSGNYFYTTNSASAAAWTVATNTPVSGFAGGPARMTAQPLISTAATGSMLTAISGSAVYSKNFSATAWPTQSYEVQTLQLVNNQVQVVTTNQIKGRPALAFNSSQAIRGFLLAEGSTSGSTLDRGWVVGDGGLFWRWVRKGVEAGPFDTTEDWLPSLNQEIFGSSDLRGVAFANASSTGWTISQNKIFVSDDLGQSWATQMDGGDSVELRTVSSTVTPFTISGKIAALDRTAWAGGSLGDKATVWRLSSKTSSTQGILSANDIEFFPAIGPQGTMTMNVALQNVGSSAIELQNLAIQSVDSVPRFRFAGALPRSIAAGATVTVPVEFSGDADPVDLQQLNPQAFFRFEDGWTTNTWRNYVPLIDPVSGSIIPLKAPTTTSQMPRTIQDPAHRDRCLNFDGGDYAELQTDAINAITGDFSLSMWVNPHSINDGQTFCGKHSATGGNRFIFGYFGGGYQVSIRGVAMSVGTKTTGWQHLAVNGQRSGANTIVSIYRNGQLLGTQTIAQVMGDISGKPWVLGGEWDSTTSINDFFTGEMDDFGLWDRLLTEGEIQKLVNESPVCGEHRANLVIQTSTESAERTIALRGTVNEGTRLIVVDSIPSGRPVKVDGVPFTTPVGFGVRCYGSDAKTWVEGSVHRIEAVESTFTLSGAIAGGNTINYGFSAWDMPGAVGRVCTVAAAPGANGQKVTATFDKKTIVPVNPPPVPAPRTVARIDQTIMTTRGVETRNIVDIEDALAGTPKGPFLRLTGGNIELLGFGGDGFDISGDLFVSAQRITARLQTDGLRIPSGATEQSAILALTPGSFRLDYANFPTDQHFFLEGSIPSLLIAGYSLTPDATARISLDATNDAYEVGLTLNRDWALLPHLLEFKKGGITLGKTGGIFKFAFKGGVRVLDLPDIAGVPDYAIDTSTKLEWQSGDTNDFNITLASINGLQVGAVEMTGALKLKRQNAGPFVLAVENLGAKVNGSANPIATFNGSISSGGELRMVGTLASGATIPLLPGLTSAKLTSKTANTPLEFSFLLNVNIFDQPRLAFSFPAMKVTLVDNDSQTVDPFFNLAGFDFDTCGSFDTGKIYLPTSVDFFGFTVPLIPDAEKDDNYFRLQRRNCGALSFELEADHLFLPFCEPHHLSFAFSGEGVWGSYRGKFCVLPDPFSVRFDSRAPCQFHADVPATDFFIRIGTGCACVGYYERDLGGNRTGGTGGIIGSGCDD